MWHLADARWRCRERRFSERQRDGRVERDVDRMRPQGDQQSLRGQRGGVGSMTLVRGHHTLLRWWPELILMIYAVI
jgi:hypothetical protein